MKNTIFKFSTLIISIVALSMFSVQGQQGFEVWIASELDEFPRDFIQTTNNEYIGIVRKSATSNSAEWEQSFIYKVSPYGDTLSKFITKEDTILVLHKIIQAETTPIKFLVSGTGYSEESNPRLWFSYFAMLNENLDVLWEHTYFLHCTSAGFPSSPQLLKEGDSSYLYACAIGPLKMYLFRLSNEGDSLTYRLYEGDSAGCVRDLTYNYDSTAYWLHTYFAHYDPSGPASQCITIDFNLNQTEVNYYPRWLGHSFSAKLLPDRHIIAGGTYWYFQYPPGAFYLAAFKIDTMFKATDSCYYTNPEVKTRGGFTSMDFYYPDCIYVGGTEGFKVGVWSPYPSWFAIAKMDNDLNLIHEKYIGGDAYYDFKTITATNDGGVLVTGTRYDYLTQDFERDALIIKLDSSDFTVGQNEHSQINISDAIIYPNPGSGHLNIRTSLKNVHFKLFDSNGHLVADKKIEQLITTLNTEHLKPGTYIWQVCNTQQVYETGKWMKIN